MNLINIIETTIVIIIINDKTKKTDKKIKY